MSARDAVTALRRFGLGARPGEVKRIGGDPRGYVLQSLSEPGRARIDDPALEPSHVTFAAAMAAQRQQRLARAAARDPGAVMKDGPADGAPPQSVPTPAPPAPPAKADPPPTKAGQIRREAFVEEAAARFHHAATTDAVWTSPRQVSSAR